LKFRIQLVSIAVVVLLAGCGTLHKRATAPETPQAPAGAAPGAAPAAGAASPKGGGAYYQDDGPGENPPANLDDIPDAVPRAEPLRAAANRPYSVLGKEYMPQTSIRAFRQRGVASWYGRKFNGAKTSSGELYDMYAMTAAHPTLPIPSYARVTNLANRRSVIVRVNDRGPFLSDRIMDLSYTAAYRLGYVRAGSATVEVESIDPANFHAASAKAGGRLIPEPVVTAEPAPPIAQPAITTDLKPLEPVAAVAAPPAEPPTAAIPAVPPATPIPDVPVSSEASGVYLQLGAFSQRDNAELFRARINRQLGWLTDPIQMKSGDGLYRLRLGPYRDRAEAERVAARIRETLELKPAVVIK
jgi:rare lipoprotein A